MEEKRMSPILIVVLSVLGTCLIIFGVWYGVTRFKGEEKPDLPVDNPPSSTPTTPSADQLGDKIDFPKSSDVNAIADFYELLSENEIKTNFKNLKKEKNGNTFMYNCEEFDSNEPSCAKIKLTINNEFTHEEKVPFGLCGVSKSCFSKTVFYKTNGYYVVFIHEKEGGCDSNSVLIYKNSQEVYKSELLVKSYYSTTASGDAINLTPVISGGKLHFVEQVDADSTGSYDKMRYKTVDLTKDKVEVNTVKEFNAYFGTCNK